MDDLPLKVAVNAARAARNRAEKAEARVAELEAAIAVINACVAVARHNGWHWKDIVGVCEATEAASKLLAAPSVSTDQEKKT